MIYLIWIMWIINKVLMLIVLLNFLIAIISQSYEESMSKEIIYRYKQRAQMNEECRLIFKTFKAIKDRSIFVLSANDSNRNKNSW